MEPRGGVGIENLGCGTGGKAECLFKRGTLGWICGTDILVLVLFVSLNLGSGSIDLSQRSKGGGDMVGDENLVRGMGEKVEYWFKCGTLGWICWC